MPDTTTSEVTWRLDRVEPRGDASRRNQNQQEVEPRSGTSSGAIASGAGRGQERFAAIAFIPRSSRVFRNWLRVLLARRREGDAPFEELLHGFAEIVESAVDPGVVESALLLLIRQVAPTAWIELVAEPSPAISQPGTADADGVQSTRKPNVREGCSVSSGQSVLEIPLRSGRSVCGRLRIRPRAGGRLPLRKQVVRRLTTLCTMTACALESLGRHPECPAEDDPVRGDLHRSESIDNVGRTGHPIRPSILIHDATFLNAVLPFALNQAKRHRESLSLLCVAIDRVSSIQDLLGGAEVNRLVQHVGQTVVTLIRASDIVARLDDNRIVAVLPRAPRGGALHVAENICRAVALDHPAGCDSSRITVSIGVATFPSCAADVYSLFDAADEALSWAQKQGRDRAVLAPTQDTPTQARPAAQ